MSNYNFFVSWNYDNFYWRVWEVDECFFIEYVIMFCIEVYVYVFKVF